MSISDEFAGAIAALAKAGMAFTTNVDSDGKQVYIVDSVALAEEEIILLHRNGALTLDGIHRYRVYRTALAAQVIPTSHIPYVTFFQYLLQAVPLNDENRTHLENCAECQALAKELTHTDRGMIHQPDPRSARTRTG
jgi:hypothetical protein